jgi:hypothetical protein
MALDPAQLADSYFNGVFSHTYLRNPYLERLQELRSYYGAAWTPVGWPDGLDLETLVNKLSTSCYVTSPFPDDEDDDPLPPPPPACPDISDPKNCHEQ